MSESVGGYVDNRPVDHRFTQISGEHDFTIFNPGSGRRFTVRFLSSGEVGLQLHGENEVIVPAEIFGAMMKVLSLRNVIYPDLIDPPVRFV